MQRPPNKTNTTDVKPLRRPNPASTFPTKKPETQAQTVMVNVKMVDMAKRVFGGVLPANCTHMGMKIKGPPTPPADESKAATKAVAMDVGKEGEASRGVLEMAGTSAAFLAVAVSDEVCSV